MLSGHKVFCNCHSTIFIVATTSRHWGLTIFRFLSGPWLVPEAILRGRVVVVAKLKNCRVSSSAFYVCDHSRCFCDSLENNRNLDIMIGFSKKNSFRCMCNETENIIHEKIENKYLLPSWNGRNPSKFDRFAGMTRIKARLAEGNYRIVQSQGSLTIIFLHHTQQGSTEHTSLLYVLCCRWYRQRMLIDVAMDLYRPVVNMGYM